MSKQSPSSEKLKVANEISEDVNTIFTITEFHRELNRLHFQEDTMFH